MSVASTQVGHPDTPLFVMCKRQNWYTAHQYKSFQTFLNPEIVEISEQTTTAWEGCISNDEELCLVERPAEALVRFQDIRGKSFELGIGGLLCRIFQHEVDHLDGQLMWLESEGLVPRKLIEKISIAEVERIGADKFYEENKKWILEV